VRIAHHERRAGRPRRAAVHARAAARTADARHMHRDTQLALEAAVHDARAGGLSARTIARLHDALAAASFGLGEYETAVGHLDTALAHDPDDVARRLRRNVRHGEALERWGRYAEADAAYERALVDLPLVADLATASRIYGGLATVRARLGELDDALELGLLAVDFAGDRPGRVADAHLKLCVIRWRRGELDDAVAHGTTAREVLDGSGDTGRLAAIANNLGLVHAARGDTELAIAHYRAAVEAFTECGNEHGLACALDNLAQALVRVGETEEAMAHLEQAVAILARIGMGSDEVFTAMWQAGSW
jgi:tetratricopeptide (TPR) repeat protein